MSKLTLAEPEACMECLMMNGHKPMCSLNKPRFILEVQDLSEPWWWNNSLPSWETLTDKERTLALASGKRILYLFNS